MYFLRLYFACVPLLVLGGVAGCSTLDRSLPIVGCATDPTQCGACVSDGDCIAPAPRCNPATNRCVTCLPAMDNCGKGTRCAFSAGVFACTPSCAVGADCLKIGGPLFECCGGTCVDPTSDPKNCGGCGKACAPVANATIECKASACGIASCTGSYADCDHDLANGCETNKSSDARNCGGCGAACSATNATSMCLAGVCAPTSCDAGLAIATGIPSTAARPTSAAT